MIKSIQNLRFPDSWFCVELQEKSEEVNVAPKTEEEKKED